MGMTAEEALGASMTYTNKKVSESAGLHREIVNSLPATGDENIIYMTLDSSATGSDIYDEWLWINGRYEHIGSTRVDLTDYYNKTQVDTALNGKQDTLSYDNVPTQNSDNMVKSGGIFNSMSTPKYNSTTETEYYEGGAAFDGNIDSSPTAGSNNAVASGGTKTYVDNAVGAKQDLLKIISGTLPNSVSALLIPYPTGVTKNDYVVIGWNILSNNNKYSGFNMGGSSSVRLLQIAMMDNGVQVTNDESAFFGKTIQIVLAKV